MAMTLSNLSVTTNSSEDPCDSISPSLHQNKLIPTIYSVIFVMGFVGNVLVVFVLCQKSNRKTVANTYMVNLALSDLLFLVSLPFWAVYYSFDYNWVFGGLMCKLCGSLISVNVYASIYFITCMSVDRYRAIVYPLQSQCSRNLCRARVVSCVIWTIAGLMTIPTVAFRDTHYLNELKVTNILAFLVPFGVIASCYYRIAKHLVMEHSSLDKSSNNLDRVMKMVVAVVLAFFICWFPFHVLTFLDALKQTRADAQLLDTPGHHRPDALHSLSGLFQQRHQSLYLLLCGEPLSGAAVAAICGEGSQFVPEKRLHQHQAQASGDSGPTCYCYASVRAIQC
uniref:G-protein coupled receptors family 1 profile domain-containing protein n=1 Tax=Esox lucius TaxID=8010 RepID=A0AAY5K443_ESOLU